ncbi:MAG: hypothetical protein V2I33_19440 [Kangiellaceae bacterium]|jgi:hypothetical protein|nr:hypothetical protein [Kangiellaceae bacterium]
MSFIWGKRKSATENSALKERLRLTNIHLSQQVEENKQLRIELEEANQQVIRTKVLLDETVSQVALF